MKTLNILILLYSCVSITAQVYYKPVQFEPSPMSVLRQSLRVPLHTDDLRPHYFPNGDNELIQLEYIYSVKDQFFRTSFLEEIIASTIQCYDQSVDSILWEVRLNDILQRYTYDVFDIEERNDTTEVWMAISSRSKIASKASIQRNWYDTQSGDLLGTSIVSDSATLSTYYRYQSRLFRDKRTNQVIHLLNRFGNTHVSILDPNGAKLDSVSYNFKPEEGNIIQTLFYHSTEYGQIGAYRISDGQTDSLLEVSYNDPLAPLVVRRTRIPTEVSDFGIVSVDEHQMTFSFVAFTTSTSYIDKSAVYSRSSGEVTMYDHNQIAEERSYATNVVTMDAQSGMHLYVGYNQWPKELTFFTFENGAIVNTYVMTVRPITHEVYPTRIDVLPDGNIVVDLYQFRYPDIPFTNGTPLKIIVSRGDLGLPPMSTKDVSFGTNNSNPRLQVFPNPSDDEIHIEIPEGLKWSGQVRLFDIVGRQVNIGEVLYSAQDVEINISHLPTGLYHVQMYGLGTAPFIKE